MDFSGRLGSFPPADLLQWAHHSRCTGELVVRRTQRVKRILFRDGGVAAAYSNHPGEYYGRSLLLNDHLTEEQLVKALNHCQQEGTRLGDAVRRLGYLSEESVQVTLMRQIGDLVCDVFLWPRGVFFFEGLVSGGEDMIPRPLDTMVLVMEGARWSDEMRRMRQRIPHDGVLVSRTSDEKLINPTPRQRRLLAELDETMTVEQLYDRVQGSYFRFYEEMNELCSRSLVTISGLNRKPPQDSMDVTALLEEQAAAEEALLRRGHLQLPLELLDRLYPVWIGIPAQPRGEMENELFASIDGNTSLADLLSENPVTRGRQTESLLQTMRDRRVALLPASAGDLERSPVRKAGWFRRLGSILPGSRSDS